MKDKEQIEGYLVNILSMAPGKWRKNPLLLLTIRLKDISYDAQSTLMFDKEQCVRIRDYLDQVLNDPESWLYMPKERQLSLKMEEE